MLEEQQLKDDRWKAVAHSVTLQVINREGERRLPVELCTLPKEVKFKDEEDGQQVKKVYAGGV